MSVVVDIAIELLRPALQISDPPECHLAGCRLPGKVMYRRSVSKLFTVNSNYRSL